jgi:hypothetical protein
MMRSGIINWSPTPLLITSGPPPLAAPNRRHQRTVAWHRRGCMAESLAKSQKVPMAHMCAEVALVWTLPDVVSLLTRCMHASTGVRSVECVLALHALCPKNGALAAYHS